ncbi:hypothetical protein ACVXG7_04045 [Enterobacter hormaechei]
MAGSKSSRRRLATGSPAEADDRRSPRAAAQRSAGEGKERLTALV